ncbi:MAG: hypothetical protein M1827_004831 [Pycnora praestabilis]|nr:MAG: hypothetical protein M1827_004831 [Pycnora praestabilis]
MANAHPSQPLTLVPETTTTADAAQNPSLPNGHSNGPATDPSNHRFDPTFTQRVIDATGPKAQPRIRKVMASMIQHIHDFARENEITVEEWMAGVEMIGERVEGIVGFEIWRLQSQQTVDGAHGFPAWYSSNGQLKGRRSGLVEINEAGRMSDAKRNEGQLLCDVIGLESLVDEITFKLAASVTDAPTSTAILGPFWRADAPHRAMGDTTVHGIEDGDHTLMYGRVTDYLTGEPVEGAELDVWHTAPNGLYEQQDEGQVDMNLRGRFTTGKDGKYWFYCLRPTSYPIPDDGPAGRLLGLLDRHPMRPAHIHFIVSAPGYKPIVTQIFDRRDEHITNDAVFAVKESLIVDFLPRKGDPKADFELPYDFKLATFEEAQKHSLVGATEESASLGVGVRH